MNYFKTFVSDQEQNVSKFFVFYRIRGYSLHGQEYGSGYKDAFSVHCGLKIFQNNAHLPNLGRSSDECMAISMLKPMSQRMGQCMAISMLKPKAQRQKLPLFSWYLRCMHSVENLF